MAEPTPDELQQAQTPFLVNPNLYAQGERFRLRQQELVTPPPLTAEQYTKGLRDYLATKFPTLGEAAEQAAGRFAPKVADVEVRTLQALGVKPGQFYGEGTVRSVIEPALKEARQAAQASAGMSDKALLAASLEGQTPQTQAFQAAAEQKLGQDYQRLSREGATGLSAPPQPYVPMTFGAPPPPSAPPLSAVVLPGMPTMRGTINAPAAAPPAAAAPSTEPLPTVRSFGAARQAAQDSTGVRVRAMTPTLPSPGASANALAGEVANGTFTKRPEFSLMPQPPAPQIGILTPAQVPAPQLPPVTLQSLGLAPRWYSPNRAPIPTLNELIEGLRKARENK